MLQCLGRTASADVKSFEYVYTDTFETPYQWKSRRVLILNKMSHDFRVSTFRGCTVIHYLCSSREDYAGSWLQPKRKDREQAVWHEACKRDLPHPPPERGAGRLPRGGVGGEAEHGCRESRGGGARGVAWWQQRAGICDPGAPSDGSHKKEQQR